MDLNFKGGETMRLTNRMKVNGELAVREMSPLAREGYSGSEVEIYRDDEGYFYLRSNGVKFDQVNFDEVEEFLELMA